MLSLPYSGDQVLRRAGRGLLWLVVKKDAGEEYQGKWMVCCRRTGHSVRHDDGQYYEARRRASG